MNVTSNQELKKRNIQIETQLIEKAEQEAIDNIKNFEEEQTKTTSTDNPV